MDPNIQIWKTRGHEFTLQVGRERVDRLNEMELLAILIVLLRGEGEVPPYGPSVNVEEAMHPRMPRGIGPEVPKVEAVKPDPNVVNVPFNLAEARDISEGMADLLCWHRGFASARRADDDQRNDPMGVETLRRAREHIRRALNLAAGLADSDLPF